MEQSSQAVEGKLERRVRRQCAGGQCKCTFSQYMVGDGCDVCNPAKALEYARETMADLQAHRDMLAAELVRLCDALDSTYMLSPEGREGLDRIQKALDFDA